MSATALHGEERETLAEILENAMRVRSHHQFFSWAQGGLYRLVPHEILICGVQGEITSPMQFYRYSATRYFRDEHFADVCHPRTGLLRHMVAHWDKTDDPCIADAAHGTSACDKRWLASLDKYELKNVAAHGVRGSDGRVRGYFCLARLSTPLSTRLPYLLRLLAPIIESTFVRVILHENSKSSHQQNDQRMGVTRREIEILQMVCHGKTNREIAEALGLSPWTIKNHLHKVFRKLSAGSRAYAITRAVALGLIQSR